MWNSYQPRRSWIHLSFVFFLIMKKVSAIVKTMGRKLSLNEIDLLSVVEGKSSYGLKKASWGPAEYISIFSAFAISQANLIVHIFLHALSVFQSPLTRNSLISWHMLKPSSNACRHQSWWHISKTYSNIKYIFFVQQSPLQLEKESLLSQVELWKTNGIKNRYSNKTKRIKKMTNKIREIFSAIEFFWLFWFS